jgi:hypothetical protein
MTDQPDNPALSAYCVTLFFEGVTSAAVLIAGSEAEAVAVSSVQAARRYDKALVSVGVMRLEAEWMRFALKTLESGEPHKAPVVSLVSDNVKPMTMPMDAVSWVCRHGRDVFRSGLCPDCERERHLMPAEAPDPA